MLLALLKNLITDALVQGAIDITLRRLSLGLPNQLSGEPQAFHYTREFTTFGRVVPNVFFDVSIELVAPKLRSDANGVSCLTQEDATHKV